MTYKMTLMALGLGVAMFTGCSSSGGDKEFVVPSTTAEAQKSIVGDYEKACYYDVEDDQSYIDLLTLKSDNTWVYKTVAYATEDCTGDSIGTEEDTGGYKLGALTNGSDGKPAFEFDIINDDNVWYRMIRFTSTTVVLSEDGNGAIDGKTPETRTNDFDADTEIWTRK